LAQVSRPVIYVARGILFSMKVLSLLLAVAAGIELTSDNWDAETAGKTAFIKFQAPW